MKTQVTHPKSPINLIKFIMDQLNTDYINPKTGQILYYNCTETSNSYSDESAVTTLTYTSSYNNPVGDDDEDELIVRDLNFTQRLIPYILSTLQANDSPKWNYFNNSPSGLPFEILHHPNCNDIINIHTTDNSIHFIIVNSGQY